MAHRCRCRDVRQALATRGADPTMHPFRDDRHRPTDTAHTAAGVPAVPRGLEPTTRGVRGLLERRSIRRMVEESVTVHRDGPTDEEPHIRILLARIHTQLSEVLRTDPDRRRALARLRVAAGALADARDLAAEVHERCDPLVA